jgi:hypothetical protein
MKYVYAAVVLLLYCLPLLFCWFVMPTSAEGRLVIAYIHHNADAVLCLAFWAWLSAMACLIPKRRERGRN